MVNNSQDPYSTAYMSAAGTPQQPAANNPYAGAAAQADPYATAYPTATAQHDPGATQVGQFAQPGAATYGANNYATQVGYDAAAYQAAQQGYPTQAGYDASAYQGATGYQTQVGAYATQAGYAQQGTYAGQQTGYVTGTYGAAAGGYGTGTFPSFSDGLEPPKGPGVSPWVTLSIIVGLLAVLGGAGWWYLQQRDNTEPGTTAIEGQPGVIPPGQLEADEAKYGAPALTTLEPAAEAGGMNNIEARFLELINGKRAEAECPALTTDPLLTEQAKSHNVAMSAMGETENFHQAGDGELSVRFAELDWVGTVAENVARGWAHPTHKVPYPEIVVGKMMENSTQQANIIDCDFAVTGISIEAGSDGVFMWTQIFGEDQEKAKAEIEAGADTAATE